LIKRVFISHPFRGDTAGNIKKVARICRKIAEHQKDVIPYSPIHAFSYLDDALHRELALDYCLDMLSLCDQLWVYGDWRKSAGCMEEVKSARALGMPVLENGCNLLDEYSGITG
jgi:hypothetical protein